MIVCAYCGKALGEIACKGRDDHLYCSALCCQSAESDSVVPMLAWWVCRMDGGGHFIVQDYHAPEGQIVGQHVTIAAGRYRVVYGPCSEVEAQEYMDDMSGT